MSPRLAVPRFVGGTNALTSLQASDERTINLFPESTGGAAKAPKYLRPTEGLEPFVVLNSSDTTGLFYQDGHCFATCGTTFSEVFTGGTFTARGFILYDGNPVTIVSNGSAGSQLCFASGEALYIYDLNTHILTNITAFAGIAIGTVEFMDGYFFAMRKGSRRVYFSALEDGTSWDTTFDYIERSWGSDDLSFIRRSGRQLYLIGTKTGEVWADVGNATQPWAPIQGAFLDVGSGADYAGLRDGETITWLMADEHGGGTVVRADGYNPKAVSSYGIVARIQAPGTDLGSAEAMMHQIAGHRFFWLYVPGMDTTAVLDLTEGVWSERAMWDATNGDWTPHVARCHAYAFEKHLIGVRDSGIVYQMDATFMTDDIPD